MLYPEYFQGKEDTILEIYQSLEDFIIRDIAKRLLKSGEMSGTADRRLWILEQMGEHRSEVLKRLSALTGMSVNELKKLLQDAVVTSWNNELPAFQAMGIEPVNPLENPYIMSIMDAQYRKGARELRNLTRTTMDKGANDLINLLDRAEIRVSSGTVSYSAAICQVIDEYASKGIMIQYPSGREISLEAAIRMCIVTSMNQTAACVSNAYIRENNIEYVLVTAHLGARLQQPGAPYCAGHCNWQGKVYKIHGSEPGYPNLLEATGYDCENDTVVNMLGLHGYNCRHSHQGWDKSLRNPYVDEIGNLKIDAEENAKRYKLDQKQRSLERAIRKTKRELMAKKAEINNIAETDVKEIIQEEYDKLAAKLRIQNKKLNDFCKEHDLQKQGDRVKVSGFNRKQASEAMGRATKYNNKLDISDRQGIIKSRVESGEYSLKISEQQYLKHVPGTRQYEDYEQIRTMKGDNSQSRLTISKEQLQDIVNKYHGTGEVKINNKGAPINIEYITVNEVVGQYFSDGEWHDTTRLAIHYGKKGSHGVPTKEKNL